MATSITNTTRFSDAELVKRNVEFRRVLNDTFTPIHAIVRGFLVRRRALKNKQDKKKKRKPPAPRKKKITFLPSKHVGECGLNSDKKSIHFPRFMMGCAGDKFGVVRTGSIPVPTVINKEFLKAVADIIAKQSVYEWDWYGFKKNILEPNREHIKQVMGLDDFFVDRLMKDGCVVLNRWDTSCYDSDDDEVIPPAHETFFTVRELDY
jgi:hypothetical protein